MSSELCTITEPRPAALQTTTVGGSKPLHRFMKGQPKTVGIVVLVLGAAFLIISTVIVRSNDSHHMFLIMQPGFLLGILFIMSGMLYILTEHNPTKKAVTISLALSIVTILGTVWTILDTLPEIMFSHHYDSLDQEVEENVTVTDYSPYRSERLAVEGVLLVVFLFYTFGGGVIVIVMSTLAGAALRPTKSQAIVVMTTATDTDTATATAE
ncbi:uncharacterized protein LOC103379013 [Cynoglossus semilaevis]|uniref:uncharacterized protein LOC103379013 n=1 Tax=Cynoglossus semilaevis TaxID=244447 RepID=UPI0004958981|nr:uncharacterized protein LOC103379013 [Cynoglossus semilaevis]XP_024911513.1 uncharacterized protein LOC103379013 [Cynoglossus semilaevis]